MPPDKKARSGAYFEGGYWLQRWSFLYGTAAILWPLLALGWSAAMRDRADLLEASLVVALGFALVGPGSASGHHPSWSAV